MRIQRRRTPGWRAPDRTLHATRPGKFGNPFEVRWYGTAKIAVARFERWLESGEIDDADLEKMYGGRPSEADAGRYRAELDERRRSLLEEIPRLADEYHFVSCWCRVGSICHADIIVRRARASASRGPE